MGEHLDMIGDGEDDLEHGVFGHEEEEDEILVSPEVQYFDDEEDDLVFSPDSEIFNDVDEDDAEGLFDSLSESLDMFKRFTKYN